MALDFRYFDPAAPADAADSDDVEVNPHWAENIVTAVAPRSPSWSSPRLRS